MNKLGRLMTIILFMFVLAACNMINFTIYFDSNGGTAVDPLRTDGSSVVAFPANPQKEGFVFRGWFWDNDTFLRSFTANSLVNEPINQNMTVYAKWLPDDVVNGEYTVLFESNGGSATSSQTIVFDGLVIEPEYPVRMGYLFQGWFKDQMLSVPWVFQSDRVEGNTTLYAKWTAAPADYYIVNFISGFVTNVPSQQVYKGTGLSAPNLVREGYTLEGWYTSLNNGLTLDEKWSFTSNVVNSNFNLYAKWIINEYTISFNANGGSNVSAITRNYNTTILKPQDPVKSGYVFGGWYSDSNFATAYTFDKMGGQNITLHAKWLRTLTYNTNGGGTIASINFLPGTAINQPTDPAKMGHTFSGWYQNVNLTQAIDFNNLPDLNLTAFAKWTVNSYKVSFVTNGGNSIDDLFVNFDQTIPWPTPVREGYTFSGWYSNEGLTIVNNTTRMTANDFSVYAKWNINQYTIAFQSNEGSAVGSITQNYMTNVSQPSNPTRTGHTFDGWFTDETLTNPYAFSTMPSQNLILYAKWIINKYQITFESNGGSILEPVFIDFGSDVSLPQNLEKADYYFGGWYLDTGLTNPVSMHKMVDQNLTIYAKWSKRIDFVTNSEEELSALLFMPGENIAILSLPTKVGHSFIGWFSDELLTNAFQLTIMPDLNFTLYAKWQINNYTISFDSNGGALIESITQEYLSIVTKPADPSRTGYRFVNWYTDTAMTEEFLFDTMPARDLTLYGKWEINQYTISFESNEGSTVNAITQNYNTVITKPADPTRTFYSFGGWFTDLVLSSPYIFSSMPAENLTLYAKWNPNNYTITLVLNGGTGIANSIIHPFTSVISSPQPTKEGYTLVGWYTDSTLNNEYVFSTMPAQNFTLYAKWSINQYQILFESNGGGDYANLNLLYNTAIPSITNPVKEGYTFVGWFTNSTFTTTFNYTKMPAMDLVLYAKWENTLTFETNGGSLVTSITKEAGSAVTTPANPTKVGHTFMGWYMDAELTQAYSFTVMPSFNTTIYAKWQVKQFIIGFEPNGGSYTANITQDYGTSLTLPTPTKEGHTFRGWFTDELLSNSFSFLTMPATNTILYAKWQINEYTIIFDSNGGSDVLSITDSYNSSVTEPVNPTKEGHTFLGWFTDIELTTEYTVSTIPSSNLTLYAKWGVNLYSISYVIVSDDFDSAVHIPLWPNEQISQIFMGWTSTAAITTQGRVFTWGSNFRGVLGDGTSVNRSIPLDITDSFNLETGEVIVQFELWHDFSAALTSKGRLFTWGENEHGQLGDGTKVDKAAPTEITSQFAIETNEKIISIKLGGGYAAALTSSGKVFTWGYNYNGQLGRSTWSGGATMHIPSPTPTNISYAFLLESDDKIVQISLGYNHSAALSAKGRVFTWGNNYSGRLGDGTTTDRVNPTEITSRFLLGGKIIQIELSNSFSSALSDQGNVYTWGENIYGQLGIGTVGWRSTPGSVQGMPTLAVGDKVISISSGSEHGILLTQFGRIFVWGRNNYGQLGIEGVSNQLLPFEITPSFELFDNERIIRINTGNMISGVLTSSYRIFLWGYNYEGSLGNGIFSSQVAKPSSPVFRNTNLGYTDYIFYGEFYDWFVPERIGHSIVSWYTDIALTQEYLFSTMPAHDLILYGKWGANPYTISFESNGGSSIDAITQDYATLVTEPSPPIKKGYTFIGWFSDQELLSKYVFSNISAGNITLYAKWEVNQYDISYQIFNEYIIQVSCGQSYSLALTNLGRVYSWGGNMQGQLGDGTTIDKSLPTDVTLHFELVSGEVISYIAAGDKHAFALTSKGRVFAWGLNGFGQLGDGSITDKSTPVDITLQFNLRDGELITSILAGSWYSMALSSDSRVFTWGDNRSGQIGDGSIFNRSNPIEITSFFQLDIGDSITQLAAGSSHSLAISSSGRVFSWGLNNYGQLGDGSEVSRLLPNDITANFNIAMGEKITQIIAGGFHSIAITTNSHVYSWGYNHYGQLGNGTNDDNSIPVDITSTFDLKEDSFIYSVSAGFVTSMAITSTGEMFTWGGNPVGELGDGTLVGKNFPNEITDQFEFLFPEVIIQLESGHNHILIVTSTGRVYSWGYNQKGQLGSGTLDNELTPMDITFVRDIAFTSTAKHDYLSAFELLIPIIEGYYFVGWYTDYEMLIPYIATTMPSMNLILYGRLIPNS